MRSPILLVLGAVLVAIGAYLALRPLFGGAPVTSSRFLDMAFAAFFLVRGVMNLRTARRPRPHPMGADTSSSR